MQNALIRTSSFAAACIGALLVGGQINEDRMSGQLSETAAAQLVGGGECEGDTVEGACCVFQDFCDGTEILCSSNPTQSCLDGEAEGFRLVAVNNRKDCVDSGPGIVGDCTRSLEDEACSYSTTCVWDPELFKCIEESPSDNMVPICCKDTCP